METGLDIALDLSGPAGVVAKHAHARFHFAFAGCEWLAVLQRDQLGEGLAVGLDEIGEAMDQALAVVRGHAPPGMAGVIEDGARDVHCALHVFCVALADAGEDDARRWVVLLKHAPSRALNPLAADE
jgi:hypothetical protein